MSSTAFGMNYASFSEFKEDVNAAISEAKWRRWLAEAAQKAYDRAMKLCPVETGWMKGQMYIEEGVDFFVIGNDADYASYNEYGWLNKEYGGYPYKPKFHKGGYRPFMRPGILTGEKYFKRQVNNWLNKFNKWAR